ncbi:MAG: hypothetical protein QXH07_01320 [Thermoplasmata archaeon]
MVDNIDISKINEYIKEIEDIYYNLDHYTDQINVFTIKYKLGFLGLINDLDKVLDELRDLKWCLDNDES